MVSCVVKGSRMRPTTGKQQGSKNKSFIPHPLTPTRDLRNVGGDYHAGAIISAFGARRTSLRPRQPARRAPCISAALNIASTAPTIRPPSAGRCGFPPICKILTSAFADNRQLLLPRSWCRNDGDARRTVRTATAQEQNYAGAYDPLHNANKSHYATTVTEDASPSSDTAKYRPVDSHDAFPV